MTEIINFNIPHPSDMDGWWIVRDRVGNETVLDGPFDTEAAAQAALDAEAKP